MSEKQGLTFDELATWLERKRQGFYLGCRIEPHSDQVNEFVRGLLYYLKKDFGYEPQPPRNEERE